jgi:hypothetical protein
MIRVALVSAAIGAAVSLVLVVVWKVSALIQLWSVSDMAARLMSVLWPASFGLLVLQPGSKIGEIVLVYSILVLCNAALYSVMGVAMVKLEGLVRRNQ